MAEYATAARLKERLDALKTADVRPPLLSLHQPKPKPQQWQQGGVAPAPEPAYSEGSSRPLSNLGSQKQQMPVAAGRRAAGGIPPPSPKSLPSPSPYATAMGRTQELPSTPREGEEVSSVITTIYSIRHSVHDPFDDLSPFRRFALAQHTLVFLANCVLLVDKDCCGVTRQDDLLMWADGIDLNNVSQNWASP